MVKITINNKVENSRTMWEGAAPLKIQSLEARLLPRQELSFSNKREPLQSLCQSYLAQGMFLFTLYRRRRHVFLYLGQGCIKYLGIYLICYSISGLTGLIVWSELLQRLAEKISSQIKLFTKYQYEKLFSLSNIL